MEEFCATDTGHRSYRNRPASPTKTVWISSPLARRLAHLALHKLDLELAETALLSIRTALRDEPVLGEMAWRMALLYALKGFQRHPSRPSLDAAAIFGGDAFRLEVFNYFQTMWEKLFVYDENSFRDCRVGLSLNGPDAPRKIEQAKVFAIPTATPPHTELMSLHFLIRQTLKWLIPEIDRLAQALASEYERRPYEELECIPEVETPTRGVREIRLGWDGGGT